MKVAEAIITLTTTKISLIVVATKAVGSVATKAAIPIHLAHNKY